MSISLTTPQKLPVPLNLYKTYSIHLTPYIKTLMKHETHLRQIIYKSCPNFTKEPVNIYLYILNTMCNIIE